MKVVVDEAAVRGKGGGNLEEEGYDDEEEKRECCYLESGDVNHNTESFDHVGEVHILGILGNK